jgi:solute carrier family 25 S-adenosylmethionine transporter 26
LGIHATAAASGNMLSSLVFVPKELVKQQMQFQGAGVSFGNVFLQILEKSGVPGLYCGYQATLMRNIPSAMLRFALYEELKYRWYTTSQANNGGGDSTLTGEAMPFNWQLFAAGACAGALASGIMTPVDVLKTRLSTGTCPVGVKSCLLHIVSEQGWKGMYAGAGSRMLWSGAFSAIGFGSFEAAKNLLGVPDNNAGTIQAKTSSPRSYKQARISTRHQMRLDHALSDAYEEKTKTETKQ